MGEQNTLHAVTQALSSQNSPLSSRIPLSRPDNHVLHTHGGSLVVTRSIDGLALSADTICDLFSMLDHYHEMPGFR
jgi:hypothetical protein